MGNNTGKHATTQMLIFSEETTPPVSILDQQRKKGGAMKLKGVGRGCWSVMGKHIVTESLRT